MAEEEKTTGKLAATADAVKGALAAVPIYQDALQPGAKQVGTALETVGKFLNLILAPVSAMVWGYEQFKDQFMPVLADKLMHKAKERLIPPDPIVAGPTLEALR